MSKTSLVSITIRSSMPRPTINLSSDFIRHLLVLSIIIFLSYHYIGIFAKNAAEDNSISPLIASWVSTIIFSPFAYVLTRRASSDKGSINLDFISLPFNWLYDKFTGQISKINS